jgi:hypothetical protein
MNKRKRLKKNGQPGRLRGIRLPRKRQSEPAIETSAAIKVRSNYEKRCAEYLSQHNIEFLYEPLMLLAGKQFRPDFYLPQYDLFLEICGYNHMPFYRDRIALKRQIYDKHKMAAVFINYDGKGSLEKLLREKLEPLGVKFM